MFVFNLAVRQHTIENSTHIDTYTQRSYMHGEQRRPTAVKAVIFAAHDFPENMHGFYSSALLFYGVFHIQNERRNKEYKTIGKPINEYLNSSLKKGMWCSFA